MSIDKNQIIQNICYTELVYGRINKKLKTQFSITEIEILFLKILTETPEDKYIQIGKNFYISNMQHKIRITVNSHTFRVITADQLL